MRSRRVAVAATLVFAVVASACSSGTLAATCDLPGVPAGACPADVQDRVAAPTDSMPALGGGELSLDQFQGHVVVLNFWASWCGPCRSEQPVLNDALAQLPAGDVAFVGVALQDSEPNAQAHVNEFGVPYPSMLDPSSRFAARFGGVGPRSIPTTIFLDRQGRVASRFFGEVTDPLQVVVLATALLEE